MKKHAGESAAIQRCQVHKRRNVLDHLTDEQKPGVAKKLNAAYALEDYAAAKQALNALHRELMDLNPSAARSLGEGMEETLTVHRLHLPMQIAEDHGQHQCDRVGVLDCRAGLPERETLAWRRPAGALGGVGPLGRGEAVSPGPGIQADSGTHQGIGSSGSV